MLLFIALFFTLFSTIFNFTLSALAGVYIVGDLGGSNDIATYTISFYSLGNALGIPLGRTLLNKIGAARFLVIVLLLFTLFSWMCAIAPNYPFLNAARFSGICLRPFLRPVILFVLFSCAKGKKSSVLIDHDDDLYRRACRRRQLGRMDGL